MIGPLDAGQARSQRRSFVADSTEMAIWQTVGIGNVAAWRRGGVAGVGHRTIFWLSPVAKRNGLLESLAVKDVRSKDWLIVAGGVLRRDTNAAIVYSFVGNAGSVILRSERKRCL